MTDTPTSTRDQICDAAYGLFMARGYDRTSIQAIIDAVGIAKGTFYHHFRSKEDLLDALTERLITGAMVQMRPILDDESLGAIAKFNKAFSQVGLWKLRHKQLFLDLLRTMTDPANAVLQARMTRASLKAMQPVLAQIIRQGVAEGVFHVDQPEPVARALLQVIYSMSEAFEHAFLERDPDDDPEQWLLSELSALEQAAERLLAAPSGSLCWVDGDQLTQWLETTQERP